MTIAVVDQDQQPPAGRHVHVLAGTGQQRAEAGVRLRVVGEVRHLQDQQPVQARPRLRVERGARQRALADPGQAGQGQQPLARQVEQLADVPQFPQMSYQS
ncbi:MULTISPECIES: hypothetical protein [unclassified Streptomyces]|uniref:hypothetical protein n=1 Tax=unclassified Streptomyces TaxID=2593676 RepID=UPI000CD535D7|nr:MULTISPECIES: hypothetical protein [unclassified Streptomyces]